MSNVSELNEIVAPKVREFPLAGGKKAVVGGLSIQMMVEIEEEFGDFDSWVKSVTDNPKIKDVANMLWGLLLNKDDFKDKKEMLTYFPANADWINEVREILYSVINKSMPTPEAKTGNPTTPEAVG